MLGTKIRHYYTSNDRQNLFVVIESHSHHKQCSITKLNITEVEMLWELLQKTGKTDFPVFCPDTSHSLLPTQFYKNQDGVYMYDSPVLAEYSPMYIVWATLNVSGISQR